MKATISSKTTLGQALKENQEGTLEVLSQFGIIHCSHCAIDENQTIEDACREAGVNARVVVNALKAL